MYSIMNEDITSLSKLNNNYIDFCPALYLLSPKIGREKSTGFGASFKFILHIVFNIG